MSSQHRHAKLVSASEFGKVTEMDRTQANTGTRDVAERLRFDEQALEHWMRANVAGFHGPLNVSQFKGGQSNPTYRLDAASGSYVLRRKPPGKLLPGAHAVEREYRVISALGDAGFPVPRVYGSAKTASSAHPSTSWTWSTGGSSGRRISPVFRETSARSTSMR
jgi:aminoglycoside phosphotransferase (APT) family kinase protein